MPHKWDKVTGQSLTNFIRIDYINILFEEDNIGTISRISLYIYPDKTYQLFVEDRASRLIDLDERFVTDLSWMNFWNSTFYICKSPRTNDKAMLEDLINNINRIEDISEIQLDLCLNVNPELTSKDVFDYLKLIEKEQSFESLLEAVKNLSENIKYKDVFKRIAQEYEAQGFYAKAWGIYEASTTEDEERILANLINMSQQKNSNIIEFIKDNHYEDAAMHFAKYYEKIGLFENAWEIYHNIIPPTL